MLKLAIAAAAVGVPHLSLPQQFRPTGTIMRKVSATIYFADLDLSTPEGAAILKHRVAMAARKACGSADHTDRAAVVTVQECIDSIHASAKEVLPQS